MKILVLNGPNLNMLGRREPELYGRRDYAALCAFVEEGAEALSLEVEIRQSNHEGVLVDWIQEAPEAFDGLLINGGAYTHTSIAILDALLGAGLPAVEVHLTDLEKREDFRQISYLGRACFATVMGEGFDGYVHALRLLKEREDGCES